VLLGYVEIVSGDFDAALRYTSEGRAALASLEGAQEFERAMLALSHVAFLSFTTDRVGIRSELAELLATARALGNPSLLANSLTTEVIATWVDDPGYAEPLLDEAVQIVADGGSAAMFGVMMSIRAQLRLGAGDVDGARVAIREGAVRTAVVGDLPQLVTLLEYAVPVLVAAGSFDAAAVAAGFAVDGPLASLGTCRPTSVPGSTTRFVEPVPSSGRRFWPADERAAPR
jgi:hypothetical protein